jgi:hypothetical protein
MRVHRSQGEEGFTVAELTVSLFVTVTVLLGVLALFDFSNRLSRVQTNVADMQQSLRVAQYDAVRLIRMAGRGGLPLGTLPSGTALTVSDNVPAATHIGGPNSPLVLPGSDVLTVRGVLSTSVYQVNSENPGSFSLVNPGTGPVSGTVVVAATTPTGIAQDLKPLRDAIDNRIPEALVVVSPRDRSIYSVVELDPATSDTGNPNQVTVGFKIKAGLHTADYGKLSPGGVWSNDLTNAAFLGIVEEYRIYVREEHADPNNAASDLTSKLSLARTFPGTGLPYRGVGDNPGIVDDLHPSWRADVADNIVDLQVSLGFDSPRGGGTMAQDEDDTGNDDRIFESADGADDDWLFNDTQAVSYADWNNLPLYYVRLTTLARTDRRDPQYQAPLLTRLEDHNLAASTLNNRTERMFRRRMLRTIIDMRNLG